MYKWSKYDYKILAEYDRRGNVINKYKTKLLEENGEVDEEGITEIIDLNSESKNNGSGKTIINKEMSININDISNSKNNSKKPESSKFIFIESLPLILADFLQSHINNAIVESEDELGKELKILFDNEILKKLNEFKNLLGNKSSLLDDINDKVKENIEIYRNILKNKKKSGENTDYIEKMIEKLLAKEIWLEHRIKLLMDKKNNNDINIDINLNTIKNINTKSNDLSNAVGNTSRKIEINDISLNQSKNRNGDINNLNIKQLTESYSNTQNFGISNDRSISLISSNTNLTSMKSSPLIINALKEIFLYYSHLHLNVKKTRLFSNLEEKKLHLDLNEFSKFCSDFNIPISRQKLVEIFKKSVSNLHYMNFKEFNNAIISLANATHESKKKNLTEKINHKKFELNSIILKEKQLKEEKKIKKIII